MQAQEQEAIPADAVIDTLIRVGSVKKAEVQMAAEIVSAHRQIRDLTAPDPEDAPDLDDASDDDTPGD